LKLGSLDGLEGQETIEIVCGQVHGFGREAETDRDINQPIDKFFTHRSGQILLARHVCRMRRANLFGFVQMSHDFSDVFCAFTLVVAVLQQAILYTTHKPSNEIDQKGIKKGIKKKRKKEKNKAKQS
jgi:hypothetical protein